ncbi:phosphohydrolase [Desulfosarcina ovata subsp. sediminis]|uniref:Phosphohydrolase n=1 Tax=Desulfosarcina ovata subsp. sediminis TaxID=885957 RepID=A0A5K7ZWL1_9BACT|nr:HD domain-containing phosphohydrolase [Desulfosarcina ovata]BBO84566.1 phosphohydrolase [Desulfosarcina ovata subsp. sediminis]
MLSEKQKLDTLMVLGIELNRIHDLDILLERVLTRARQFVNADAGSIYIREGDRLNFAHSQNDTLQSKLAAGEKLIYSTFSVPINPDSIAGYAASTKKMLSIPDVYRLSLDKQYRFSRQFDEVSGYVTRAMLTIPLMTSKKDVLGILQMINPQDREKRIRKFSESDEKVMLHFAGIAAVALERAQMTRAMILRMIRMAEMRDPMETGAHVNRVADFSLEIYEHWAKRHQVPQKEIDKTRDVLRMAAMLHDVGKVATSDLILKKPSQLSHEEFEIMKQHTIQGARLFSNLQSDYDEAAAVIALNHHEKWDGSGYPGHVDPATGAPLPGHESKDGAPLPGKKGYEIPIFGRIVAIADVYDALSSKRSYKAPWDEANSIETISQGAGSHFDPELVEIFLNRFAFIRAIQDRYAGADTE